MQCIYIVFTYWRRGCQMKKCRKKRFFLACNLEGHETAVYCDIVCLVVNGAKNRAAETNPAARSSLAQAYSLPPPLPP
jgi:hypothetical protein